MLSKARKGRTWRLMEIFTSCWSCQAPKSEDRQVRSWLTCAWLPNILWESGLSDFLLLSEQKNTHWPTGHFSRILTLLNASWQYFDKSNKVIITWKRSPEESSKTYPWDSLLLANGLHSEFSQNGLTLFWCWQEEGQCLGARHGHCTESNTVLLLSYLER